MRPADEWTADDLLDVLEHRTVAMVVAFCAPDDKGGVRTVTRVTGNRATVLGLSHILVAHAESNLGLRGALDSDSSRGEAS